jgi:transposase
MHYIGIDIAKNTHCFVVVDNLGKTIISETFFSNNFEGFSKFDNLIKSLDRKDTIVGLEATGHYGNNLVVHLLSMGFKVGLINPLTTDAMRKVNIRKAKNDKIDSLLIVKVLISGNYNLIDEDYLQLNVIKDLTRYRSSLKEDINQLKNKLQKNIDLVYPEFNSLFNSKYGRTYIALLLEFSSANNIANAHLNKIKSVIKCEGRGRRTILDPKELREHASNSIGQINTTAELSIKQIIIRINLIEEQLKEVNKKIEELAIELDSPILSIPGIGCVSGMSILSEIGNINNFSSYEKLIGYAGVDPATYSSGEYNADRTAISKRGSRYLRKALYQVALTVVNNIPTYKSYYNLKRSQGKSHRCAQGHIVRKLLRMVFKLLSENIKYNSKNCI